MTNPFVPILWMAAIALVLALGGLGLSAIVGPKSRSRFKVENYECGVQPTPGPTHGGRFPVRFYLVAMTFIIFDVEVVFMYPWAVSFREVGMFGLVAMLSFIFLITVPFLYEWRRGGLDWE